MDYLSQGFLPGPHETQTEFEARVAYCLELRQSMPEISHVHSEDQQLALENAATITYPLFGFKPHWIPVLFSNHKLLPWHGGCAWIFRMNEHAPQAAFLQLRSAFRTQLQYFGLYSRNELLAHEICHVARMCFEEPVYEELLAYKTSPLKWRRWLGPIIRNSVESMFFLLSLLLVMAACLFSLFVDPIFWDLIPYLYIFPAIFMGYGCVRLLLQQRTITAAKLQLEKIFGSNGQKILIWLTDKEIKSFGKSTSSEIKAYFEKEHSYRIKLLLKTFPMELQNGK